jgi:hypothetical protein
VLRHFKVIVPEGEMDIEPGQIVILPQDKGIKLLNEGKIEPIERVTFKVWSEVLQGYLWVVYDEEDIEVLRKEVLKDSIYTILEVKQLKGLSKSSLKDINQVKEIFLIATVEKILKRDSKE